MDERDLTQVYHSLKPGDAKNMSPIRNYAKVCAYFLKQWKYTADSMQSICSTTVW